jgi:Peptidase family M23
MYSVRTRFSRILSTVLLAAVLATMPAALTPAVAHAAGDWLWPVAGEILTPFHDGDDRYAAGQHRGIDIAAPAGTAVGAATGGSVTFAGRLPDSGYCVTVVGADGVYQISYLHLSAIAVKRGVGVAAGATIGSVGTTGKRSVAEPHLHLGVRLKATGAYVDPLPLLGPPAAVQAPAGQRAADAMPVVSAPPSVVKQPSQRAGARSRPHAGAEVDANARGRADAHHRRAVRDAPGATRPTLENVHAHSIGDTASAAPTVAARGSARESHASRGRVAPPPLPVMPQSLRSRTAAHRSVVTPPPGNGVVERSTPRDAGHGHWPLWLLIALAAATGALLLARRRPTRDVGPVDGTDPVVITRPVAHAAPPSDSPRPKLHVVAR